MMREEDILYLTDYDSSSNPPEALLERLKDYGQDHVLSMWEFLPFDERQLLIEDLESLNHRKIDRIVRCSLRSLELPAVDFEPVPDSSVSTVDKRTMEEREMWWNIGLQAIFEGELGVVLLSGGQDTCGSCLGSSDPKGCFNIGLPSGKSLFQLQAERILILQRLAAQCVEGDSTSPKPPPPICWYIMTSPLTDEPTREFFESNKYFGLQADQVTFFQEATIPCVSPTGKYIMETPYRVAKSLDGNVGVYSALESSMLLEDMSLKGIKYVDCYGVDNALVRVGDPMFLGYFMDKEVDAAAKVVRKAYPEENVGVFVQRGKDGPISVVEYSELDSFLASDINQETSDLFFRWSDVCQHMFTLNFLKKVAFELERDNIYHITEKYIDSIYGATLGYELEQFVSDAFPCAPAMALFEVLREEEFAPLKNVYGSDSEEELVLRLHAFWVDAAGGFLTPPEHLDQTESGVEVSSPCSDTGENLEFFSQDRTFDAPCEISFSSPRLLMHELDLQVH